MSHWFSDGLATGVLQEDTNDSWHPDPYDGGGIVICTDIDGTLRCPGEYDPPPELVQKLRKLSAQGVRLAIATGKGLRHAEQLMGALGIRPIVVCAEDGGHIRSRLPRHATNTIQVDLNVLQQARRHLLECAECGGFERTTSRALEEEAKKSLVTVFFGSAGIAQKKCSAAIVPHLTDLLGYVPVVYWYADGAVDIKSSDIPTKGGVVVWLRQRFFQGHQAVLVMGDGLNDLSMFERSGVTHRGCPANAAEPLQTLVRECGGFIAQHSHGEGALEILEHFTAQGVLPAV